MCTHKRILASENDLGKVTECGCGTIHITIGPVSVALNDHAVRRLHALLGTAVQRLSALPDNGNSHEEKCESSTRVH